MKTITRVEIDRAMKAAGVFCERDPLFLDNFYVLPTLNWVLDTCLPAFRSFLWAVKAGVPGPGEPPESADCDNVAARYAWTYASLLHQNSSARPDGELAFGFFGYRRDDLFDHVLNVVIVGEGEVMPVWIETNPKLSPGKRELSSSERSSCYSYVF